MGKRAHKVSSGSLEPHLSRKLLKCSALGDANKVRKYLKRNKKLVHATDPSGNTALHEACRHGNADVVKQLLKRGADANVQNCEGNTPAHLAVLHQHPDVLLQVLQADLPPDVDLPNAQGITLTQLMAGAQQQGPSDGRRGHEAGGGRCHRGSGGRAGGSEDEWQARLREEMSDEEVGGIGWARYAPKPEDDHPSSFHQPWGQGLRQEEEEDDVWAERLWRDMQEHRHQQQQAAAAAKRVPQRGLGFGGGAGEARREAAEKAARRAEEAKAESARILREEQAKDADWREAMLRQVQEAALPMRFKDYEERWLALDRQPASQSIRFGDIPWPGAQQVCKPAAAVGTGPGASLGAAAAVTGGGEALVIDPDKLRHLLLHGCKGPGDVKKRLRAELMRWHPDKFGARFEARVAAGDRERVRAGVQAVAQQLTALMSSGGAQSGHI